MKHKINLFKYPTEKKCFSVEDAQGNLANSLILRGGGSLVARLAHNQEIGGSNPSPATNF